MPFEVRIVALTAFLVGAGKVTSEMRSRILAGEKVVERVALWHGQITLELPLDRTASWEVASAEFPLLLLRATSIEGRIN